MVGRQYIFDPLRRKNVPLTPEEEVRQHFIQWLSGDREFPKELMASEYFIRFNGRNFRCDIVCFTKSLKPLMIVECKAPSVKIDRETVEQVCRYNLLLQVKYLVITNGVVTFACEFDQKSGSYRFISDIPKYAECTLSE